MLVLTTASQDSKHVTREVDRAITYEKTIIPVKLENVELNADFSYYLSTTQIVAVSKLRESAPELKALLVRIKSILGSANKDTMRTEFEDTKLKPRNERKSKNFFVTAFGRLLSSNSKREASKREKTADRQQTAIKDNKISACNDNNTERIVNINDGVGCVDTNTSTGAMQQNIHKHYTVEEVLDKYNYESTISDMSRLRCAEDIYIKMCNGQQYNLNISEFGRASDLHVSYGTLTRYTGNSPVVVLPEYIIKIGSDAFSGTNVKALICMGPHMRIEGRYLPQNVDKRLAVEVLLCNGLDYVGPNLMENVKCFIINRLFDEQLSNIEVDNLKFFYVNDASNMMSLPPKIASISNKNNYILQINGLDGSKNIS